MISGARCHVTNKIDVVIEMSSKVLVDVSGCASRVADELAFGHLVFDVRTRKVDGEEDEGEADDVDRVCARRAKVSQETKTTTTLKRSDACALTF